MRTFGKILTIVGIIAVGMGVIGMMKKPGSVYKNNPEEQTVNGPVNFNNTTKILVLSLPVIDG